MIGSGFGGCAISLLPAAKMEPMQYEIGKTYQEMTGLSADFYVAEPSEGARKLESYE
jgi:galactokinase